MEPTILTTAAATLTAGALTALYIRKGLQLFHKEMKEQVFFMKFLKINENIKEPTPFQEAERQFYLSVMELNRKYMEGKFPLFQKISIVMWWGPQEIYWCYGDVCRWVRGIYYHYVLGRRTLTHQEAMAYVDEMSGKD